MLKLTHQTGSSQACLLSLTPFYPLKRLCKAQQAKLLWFVICPEMVWWIAPGQGSPVSVRVVLTHFCWPFLAICASHLPVFTQTRFPLSAFNHRGPPWQVVFPRRPCPPVPALVSERLAGGWREQGGWRRSEYFSSCLWFEWHLWWAAATSTLATFQGFLLAGSPGWRGPAATCPFRLLPASPSLFRFSVLLVLF